MSTGEGSTRVLPRSPSPARTTNRHREPATRRAAQAVRGERDKDGEPTDAGIADARSKLVKAALVPLATNPRLRDKLVTIRRAAEQILAQRRSDRPRRQTVADLRAFREAHRDELA